MAWTNPRTWVAGELVTASQLNTHLRDNLSDLDSRAAAALVFDNTDGRNLAGTETVLYTYTVPAATFAAVKTVHLFAVGQFATTDNMKIVRIRVGGLTGANVMQVNGTTTTNGKVWWAEAFITRSAANQQRVFGTGEFIGAAAVNERFPIIGYTTLNEASPIDIVVTGEAPNAQEVVYTSSWVQTLG